MSLSDLTLRDFDYALPPDLIAQTPLSERSASRLLLVEGRRGTGCWRDLAMRDLAMRDLPSLLNPGDLLVFNDTRVVPARLPARKPTGGRIEIFLERALPEQRALVQLGNSKAIRTEMLLSTQGGEVRVVARRGEMWEVELPAAAHEFFERHGRLPLPPYIRRDPQAADMERYQSLWARVPGAVAAPTASLHFDHLLLSALEARGIERSWLTLHVGAGTFAPVRTEQLADHRLHSERYELNATTVEAISRTRQRGGRVVAVGTTVARALESAARADAPLEPTTGETSLFIRPGFQFRVTDALLTNFHLPQSTLLMLVAAFAGRETVLGAYAHAVQQRYRFFSYGDAMLVFP